MNFPVSDLGIHFQLFTNSCSKQLEINFPFVMSIDDMSSNENFDMVKSILQKLCE